MAYCDRVIWIENGAIKEEGEAMEVVNKYKLSVTKS
jgi:ABC-type polysaccharide/polyol phosphate transport system ATPase subunit